MESTAYAKLLNFKLQPDWSALYFPTGFDRYFDNIQNFKNKSLKKVGPTYNEKYVCLDNPCSLGAPGGYIQPIFYKRFDPFSL